MRRRYLLSLSAAGLVGVAGCAARDGGDGGNGDATATGTDAETPAAAVTVSRVRVLPSLVGLTTPDSLGVVGDAGMRYVLVTVAVADTDRAPDREQFVLEVGGAEYAPTTDLGSADLADYHALGEDVYAADDPAGDLPFEVPRRESPPDVSLAWAGASTLLPAVGDGLARPGTTFSVESFAATADGGQVTAAASVTNTGDTTDWFVAGVNRQGPSVAYAPVTGVAFEVAPDETREWTHVETVGNERGDAEFSLVTETETYRATVTVGDDD